MKKISLVVYEDAVLSSVSGVVDLLFATNGYLQQRGQPPAFDVELVCSAGQNIQLRVPAAFACSKTFDDIAGTDLIIVPAFYINPPEALAKNQELVKWIKKMYAAGTEIASLCLGSFFLAEAGLLASKSCASHWMGIDDMRHLFPNVNVLADIVITDNEGIYTSGGALLSWNLILYLVEKFCGHDVSVGISKMFNLDPDRVSQSQFVVFQGQRRHEDKEILEAQTYIEDNFHLPISVEQVAQKANMSKRNFIRRFKIATNNTPLEYMQRVKIESAKKALEKKNENVSSLMYNVGYNDVKTFRKVFKQITGITPQEYRRKYSRDLVHSVL